MFPRFLCPACISCDTRSQSRDAFAAPGWLEECYKDDPWHNGGDAIVVQFKATNGKRVLLQRPVMETFWMAAGMGLE
jgi:hypothetical protein